MIEDKLTHDERRPDGSGFYPCAAATFDATYEVVE